MLHPRDGSASANSTSERGQLIGFVTRAIIAQFEACNEKQNVTAAIILNEGQGVNNTLPWHIRYDSFSGVLPRIGSITIQVVGMGFLFTGPLGVVCLYKSTEAFPAYFHVVLTAGVITALEADGTKPIKRNMGGLMCPAEVFLSRAATMVTVQGGTTMITVTLVQ